MSSTAKGFLFHFVGDLYIDESILQPDERFASLPKGVNALQRTVLETLVNKYPEASVHVNLRGETQMVFSVDIVELDDDASKDVVKYGESVDETFDALCKDHKEFLSFLLLEQSREPYLPNVNA